MIKFDEYERMLKTQQALGLPLREYFLLYEVKQKVGITMFRGVIGHNLEHAIMRLIRKYPDDIIANSVRRYSENEYNTIYPIPGSWLRQKNTRFKTL